MIRLVFAILISSAVTLFAEDYGSILKQDREVITQQLERINADSKKTLDAWPAQYLQSLKSLEASLTKGGNLEGVLAVRKEVARFKESKQFPQEAILETPEELRVLQQKAFEGSRGIDVERNKHIISAIEKYVSILDEMKKNLTKKGKLDQALAVSKEMDAMTGSPELLAAKAVLDAAGVERNVDTNSHEKNVTAGMKDLENGLILHYSFDKDEGRKVKDKSGKGNDGDVHGAVWVSTGKFGGGFKFGGGNDYVSFNQLFTGNGDLTVSAWVKFSKADTSYMGLIGVGNNANSQWIGLYVEGGSGGKINAASYAHGGRQSSSALSNGQWHLITGVFTGGRTVELYVDGVSQGTASSPYNVALGSKNAIGNGADPGQYWDGLIDDARIYTRALSAEEIKNLYTPKK